MFLGIIFTIIRATICHFSFSITIILPFLDILEGAMDLAPGLSTIKCIYFLYIELNVHFIRF